MILSKLKVNLRTIGIYYFSVQKYKESDSKIKGYFIKNQNLHFQDSKSHLYLSPMYPQLTQKGQNTFTINSQRIVMFFKFISKAAEQKKNDQSKNQERHFSFKYSHLSALVGIEPNSNLSTLIVRPKMESMQVIDDPKSKQVHFNLRKATNLNQLQPKNLPIDLRFSCNYAQYRVMNIILKKSLFDLSGMYLIHEIKRMEAVGQNQKSLAQIKKKVKLQVDQFYQEM